MQRYGLASTGLAAVLYAFFSNPTPDTPGIIEAAIALLLLVPLLSFYVVREQWVLPLGLLLAYGLTVPSAIGVLSAHASGNILRDVIAFLALAIPFLLAPLYARDDYLSQGTLLVLLLGIGFVFSARFLLSSPLNLLASAPLDHGFLYLANSSLVAFTAAWLLLRGSFVEKRPWLIASMILAALIPIAAMIGMMQRATLALLALTWLGFLLFTFVRQPRRATLVSVLAGVFLFILWPLPLMAWEALADKTLNVGWNARGDEVGAIWDILHSHPLTTLFGAGWGDVMKSPAVGDQWVRFSHSFFTSLWWKTGWLGLILGVGAIGAFIANAYQRLRHDIVTFCALMLPLLPALFLYGSYKSLCFGLLLLAIARLGQQKDLVSTSSQHPSEDLVSKSDQQ